MPHGYLFANMPHLRIRSEYLMLLLLTNDDGVTAEGLSLLRERLRPLGQTVICAPDRNCSASSRKLTLDRPLNVVEIEDDVYAVDGTPADSVLMALHHILPRKPDLVVSGINAGPNLGEDVFYSGTVGAAMEARSYGVPSVAVSLASWTGEGLEESGGVAVWIVEHMLNGSISPDLVLNVNIPGKITSSGARLTRLGKRRYVDLITKSNGPRGREVYWIGGEGPLWEKDPLSDHAAIEAGVVSVTPLGNDLTDYEALRSLKFNGLLRDHWHVGNDAH